MVKIEHGREYQTVVSGDLMNEYAETIDTLKFKSLEVEASKEAIDAIETALLASMEDNSLEAGIATIRSYNLKQEATAWLEK